MIKIKTLILALAISIFLIGCGNSETTENSAPKKIGIKSAPKEVKPKVTSGKIENPLAEKGIGPIKSIELGELDPSLATEGQALFEANCAACHKIEKKFVGPKIKGVLERRSPEWVMNMILNPEEMIAKDPLAKQVLIENNMAVMANQNLTEDQARKILEYFRTI